MIRAANPAPSKPRPEPRRGVKHVAALIVVCLGLAATGCGASGDAPGGGVDDDGVLDLAMSAGPTSLDPAQHSTAFNWYWDLAYDTPIEMAPDGSLEPGLAESWGYVGKDNLVFELTLRSGVKFSDGTDLTAEVVKANLERAGEDGNIAASRWGTKTIEVTGPLTLRVTSESPDPSMEWELTGTLAGAHIVSAQALADPDQLGTATAGAGPYTLDPDETVANDHYTYVPNEHYWNPDAVHYDKVVIHVMADQNSVLNALKTGQIDAAPGDYTVATAAKGAGLQVSSQPSLLMGLDLVDRAGKVVPALGDVRVRQALNYAVDRDKITEGLFGDFGTATDQVDAAPSRHFYDYDPDEARRLLEEAGYADGLTIPVLTTTYNGQNRVVQAIGADLEKVGVTLELVTKNYDVYPAELQSHKYAAAGIGFGTLPSLHIVGPALFLPSAATFNPFGSADAQVESDYAAAAAAPEAQRAELYDRIQERLADQGWFLLVTAAPKFYFASSAVAGLEEIPVVRPLANATWITPAD